MLKNYFKIALRTFRKDKSFTAINLLGLASGLAITLMIIQYVRFELSYENNYPKKEQLARITTDIINEGEVVYQDCETYPPLAQKLKDEIPEIVNSTRAYPIGEPSLDVEIADQQYIVDKVYGIDPAFFDMFDIHFLSGSRSGLFEASAEAVISETLAKRYFNSIDVVGKSISIVANGGKLPLTIKGVVEDSPPNTHLKFDMLISYPTLISDFGEEEDNWGGNNSLTYIELAPNASYQNFQANLDQFNIRVNEAELVDDEAFIAQKIADIHLYSKKSFEVEPNNEARSVYLLLIVAFLVIISALVNYVNLTTSKALDRAKEMGMRKVVGSTTAQIKAQVFMESFLVNVFAGFIAVFIIALTQAAFINTAGLPSSFSVFTDPFFWLILGAILLLSILFSALYPAFILSSFEPSQVLKGSFTRSKKGILLRKGLVVFQFGITVVLLVQAFAVYLQLDFMRNLEKGLDVEKTIVVRTPTGQGTVEQYGVFKQNLMSNASVKNLSFATTVPGRPQGSFSTTTGIALSDALKENNYNFYINQIDSAFFSVLDIEILGGKDFDMASISLDQTFEDENNKRGEVIVNEEATRLWGISDPQAAVGKELSFWGASWNIRAVVKDYNHLSPKSAQIPIIHMYQPKGADYISIKFEAGDPAGQLAIVRTQYESDFPGKPFSYFFLDTEYDQQFKADERFQTVFTVITLFAILIACLGLFGLATFTVLKRTKEIGIRKSIGASTTSVLMLLSKDFMKTVAFSMLIGIPITYFLVNNWLSNYANRMELNWWLFAIPVLAIFALVILSISGKTIKTALMNPVESLKTE